MQISLNGIKKQPMLLTTNMGIKRTHREIKVHIKVIGHSTLDQTKMSWVDDIMESQSI